MDHDTCLARIRVAIDSPWRIFGRRPIIGSVGQGHVSLRRRRYWRGTVHASLDVSLLPDGRTLLICRAGLHPMAMLLGGGWAGLFIALGGLMCLFAVAGGFLDHYWPLVAIPALLSGALGLAVLFSSSDTEADHGFLIGQLALMTEATPI